MYLQTQQGAKYSRCNQYQRFTVLPRPPAGSLGDLDGSEENTPDNLSLSGEEGGASDPDDSAEGDSSSPPPYTPLYNEGERREILSEESVEMKGMSHRCRPDACSSLIA